MISRSTSIGCGYVFDVVQCKEETDAKSPGDSTVGVADDSMAASTSASQSESRTMTESVTWLASLSNTASDWELHAAGQ